MKNLLFIFCLLMGSATAYAQSDARFYDTEGEYKKGVEVANSPGDGGLGGDDPAPAPIDDYLPLLLLTAMAMAVYYARKKQVKTES